MWKQKIIKKKAHNKTSEHVEEEGRKFIAKKSHSSPLICRLERYYLQDKRRENKIKVERENY